MDGRDDAGPRTGRDGGPEKAGHTFAKKGAETGSLAPQIGSLGSRQLVIASNRGPISFAMDSSGKPQPAGSGGGLASTIRGAFVGLDATWVGCAMSEADSEASRMGLTVIDGIKVVTVEPDPDAYRMAYDVVSNRVLWYALHGMFDLVRRPRFDRSWDLAFESYRQLNQQFCEAISTETAQGAVVLVQDYHLMLLPGMLRSVRPDLAVVHFTHTPFPSPSTWRVLPTEAGRELLLGISSARACGFHTDRWRRGFTECCEDAGVTAPATFISPLGPDAAALGSRRSDPRFRSAKEHLKDTVGDRRVVLRVDRIEPSKNLLRGFWAFDELLDSRPDLRERIVHVALCYASRQSLPEYLAYASEVHEVVRRINERWGSATWTPIVLDTGDDAQRSLAALSLYDVLLVNPIADGLNLVAKEGPVLNDRSGMLVLSREAGAFAELEGPAIEVNPFDVSQTARAIGAALDMDEAERTKRAADLRQAATARSPQHWLADLLAMALGPHSA